MTVQFNTTRDLLAKLIAFDTTSRNSNLALIDFVRDYLSEHGVDSLLIHNEDGKKANLYATLGPDKAGGIVLSGHTDVVPVDGQQWRTDPFTMIERDGKLFGRGTADMKGFLALALAYVPTLLAKPMRRPIHLAFSYDEEVGCVGVGSMIDRIVKDLPKPDVVIVGEPTDMKVVNRHKGIRTFVTHITGQEAHSSKQNLGANAISAAGTLIHELSQIAGRMQAPARQDPAFDPPHTTLNVGMITGGSAVNIIAKDCKFAWEYRCLPGTDEDEIIREFEAFSEDVVLPRLRKTAPDAAIRTNTKSICPGLNVTEGSPAETLVLALAAQNDTQAVSFTTEAGLFDNAGMAAVVCGPGSIDQAHKPDEFIEIEQLQQAHRFMDRLCDHIHG